MTATATRRTTDHSSDDRAEGGLPTTSAHPRPSSPLAGASEPARRSQPTPSPPAGGHTDAPSATVPRGLLRRNRARATVTALAKEFGVSFDWVARRIIAAGTRRDQLPPRRARRRPAGARLGRVARRPVGRRRRRWRPQPAVARHPLDGPQCAPPLRGTARRTLRRCWGQYWPIRSTGAFRCVRRSPAPLSNRGPAGNWAMRRPPSRRRRELSAAPPHSIVTNLVTIVMNRSRTLDARASGTTARARRAP